MEKINKTLDSRSENPLKCRNSMWLYALVSKYVCRYSWAGCKKGLPRRIEDWALETSHSYVQRAYSDSLQKSDLSNSLNGFYLSSLTGRT